MIKIKFNYITPDVYNFILDATTGLLTDQEITDYVDSDIVIRNDAEDFLYTLILPFKVIKSIEEFNDVLHITFRSNICVEINDCDYERIEII